MDWLTFFSNAIDSLSWPLVAVIGLWWVTKHVASLLPLTKKLRYGDLEVEFGHELDTLKRASEAQKRRHPAERKMSDIESIEALRSTAEISPRAAIADAWVGLEITATSSARMLQLIPSDRVVPFRKVIESLRSAEVIGEKDVEILNRLRTLRNGALHAPTFSVSLQEVEKFIELAHDQAGIIASEAYQKSGGCSR
jgi:hypothetical protein